MNAKSESCARTVFPKSPPLGRRHRSHLQMHCKGIGIKKQKPKKFVGHFRTEKKRFREFRIFLSRKSSVTGKMDTRLSENPEFWKNGKIWPVNPVLPEFGKNANIGGRGSAAGFLGLITVGVKNLSASLVISIFCL